MRTTQFMGLNEGALQFIDKNANYHEEKKCEHCGSILRSKIAIAKDLDIVTGMFGEQVHVLQRYNGKNGRDFEEYVQADPWSSGPVIFLALRWSDGDKESIKESSWSVEEINDA